VAGRQVDEWIVARVSGLSGGRLRQALREAVSHRVLLTDAGTAYRFRHWLAQEAIYRDLLPGERMERHAALAAALAEDPLHASDPARMAEVAHHWHAAGRRPEALAASVTAGRTAIKALAYAEALRHLERAGELAPRVPDADTVAGLRPGELLALTADAARWTGDIQRAVQLGRQALGRMRVDQDRLPAALLWNFLGRCLYESGDSTGSIGAYQRAGQLLPADAPAEARAWAAASEAGALMLASRYRESLSRAQEALAIAREAGALREESHALCTIGVALSMLGDLPSALAALRESLELAEQIDNLEEVCRVHTNLSSVLEMVGELEEAAQVALDGLERARKMGLELTGGGILAGNAALVLFKLGRWAQAEQLIADLLPDLSGLMRAYLMLVQAMLMTGRGELAEAREQLSALGRLTRQNTEAQLLGPLYAQCVEVALLDRKPYDAAGAVRDGLKAVAHTEDQQYVVRLCALGVRALADIAERGRAGLEPLRAIPALVGPDEELIAGARRLADQAQDGMRELAAQGAPVPEADADLAECLAELGRCSPGGPPEVWDDPMALWEKLAQPYRAAYARYRKAEAMVGIRTKDARAAAADLLRDAHAQAVRLGAPKLVSAIGALAVVIRVTLDDAPSDAAAAPSQAGDPFHLTPREREVLPYLAQGRSNQQIARRLDITASTVGVHVGNIMHKLKVSSRAEAAAMLHRLGMVDLAAAEPDPG
jgi:DNA-binding CsgD family transcriptional regulator/tetratricopeptide (TPR) repeat protein